MKDYWLNNISFCFLLLKVSGIYNCPSQDIFSFVELQYIFSIFYPDKMNFYYKQSTFILPN